VQASDLAGACAQGAGVVGRLGRCAVVFKIADRVPCGDEWGQLGDLYGIPELAPGPALEDGGSAVPFAAGRLHLTGS